jgi:Lon protease-like protein
MGEDEYTGKERRRNLELRERLDELFDLARELYNESINMSQEELDEARARIEWLAEEIWAAAVYGPIEQRSRRRADPEAGEE